jgi:cohesin loading factor subunit SCC2
LLLFVYPLKPEEQVTSDYLLKIFRVSIPHMPKTAVKFGNELQLALQPMILKPSTAGGVQVGYLNGLHAQ